MSGYKEGEYEVNDLSSSKKGWFRQENRHYTFIEKNDRVWIIGGGIKLSRPRGASSIDRRIFLVVHWVAGFFFFIFNRENGKADERASKQAISEFTEIRK